MRWTVVRIEELASRIGPDIVDRLTVGDPDAPIGRAAAGSIVGSPTPRREDVARPGSGASAPASAAWAEAAVGWWLAVGIAEREMTVLDGARRIPPDGAGRAAAAAAGVVSACEGPVWLRWTGERTTDAADVRGRSGTRTALRDTVGSERTGVISGAGWLVVWAPSSASGAALAGDADPATGIGSGSPCGTIDDSAGDAAAWRWTGRPDRFGAGIDADDAVSTACTRATTSPGAAIGLTS